MRVGEKVGRLTIISKSSRKTNGGNYVYYCECRCDCGNMVTAIENNMRKKKTLSCGCLYRESRHDQITHGQRNTRLYRIWTNMKTRCTNEKSPSYRYYGARGISVCSEWKNSFETFSQWAHMNGYSDLLTIDRKSVAGNYDPDNCRWVDRFIQARNKRTNLTIEIDGQAKCLKEWCVLHNLPYKIVHQKIMRSSESPEIILRWYLDKLLAEKEA